MKNCNWGGGQASGTGGLLPPSLYVKRGSVNMSSDGLKTNAEKARSS